MKKILLSFMAVFALTANAGDWTRCTTVADITAGGTYIIGYEATANSEEIIPMKNNGGTATITTAGYMASASAINMTSVTETDDYEIQIVPSTVVPDAVCIKIGDNFIGNTNTKNNCKLFNEEATTTAFNVTVGTNDVFTFKIAANATYTTFQYNPSSPRFAVYGGTQKNLVVYKKSAGSSENVAVESVSITDASGNAFGTNVSLTVGESLQLKATVTPNNATNKKVTWSVTQDENVISIENGLVKALAAGTATVVVTTEDGEKQATVTIVVSKPATATIAEFIAAEGMTCYLTGTVSGIQNTTYGNFNLTDDSGTIFVYGCLNAAGESKKFEELGVKEGDVITVLASEYKLYGETHEAVNVVFVENHGTPTAINNITTIKNDATYNLAGQRINANVKGIAIMNGKKFMVK